MDMNELLEYLDLESPEEFEYFEHLADLLELEEAVSSEACYALFSAVSEITMTELLANYFEEIMENMPDDTIDIYTLLTTIRQCLLGLARSMAQPDGLRLFVDEFVKFRDWYSMDSIVHCKRLSDGHCTDVTVGEALALSRLEKLNGNEYDYDFSDCLDYEIDEYSMSLSDIIGSHSDEDEVEIEAEAEDHCRRHDHDGGDEYDQGLGQGSGFDVFSEGLVDRNNPVIDGEYEED